MDSTLYQSKSAPITLDHLFATVMHVLLDREQVLRDPSVPRDISDVLTRSRVISELV